jgi:hypothetical protein
MPWININLKQVVEAFQNLSYIGEMRQRWEEIKKLQHVPIPALTINQIC